MLDPTIATQIRNAVDHAFDEQLAFLAELVKIPSLRGQEAPAQDLMAAALRQRGYGVDRWQLRVADLQHLPGFSPVVETSYDNAWNVVGVHRPTQTKGRSLILNGHVDVVPTGPPDMWQTPPFVPRLENGWMYGRGAGDMKAGLTANLYALDALRRAGYQPAADLYLQTVIEEECTGNGALACIQRGYKAEAALLSEPSALKLRTAQVGVIWLQIDLRGQPAHAARASQGLNAIEAGYLVMQALHDLEAEWNAAKHPAYTQTDHPINFVLSRISGGDWTSSVPAQCVMDVRLGIYPDRVVADCQREIETVIHQTLVSNPKLANMQARLIYHGFLAPGYVLPPDTLPEQTLRMAHQAVFQSNLETSVNTALTDARFFGLYQNTPALVYGPICESAHGLNERVNLESLRQTTQVIALFVAEWCGLEQKD